MTWRLAKSLERLRDQVNAAAPRRDKSADGTIGDTAHSARKSDHNPNRMGVVCAIDITHDPACGLDSYALAEALRKSGDLRISYIISNGKIANSGAAWRKYHGSNPHSHHVHVSVAGDYDDMSDWQIGMGPAPIVTRAIAAVIPKKNEYPTLRPGAKGADVRRLQSLLGITVDGYFGKRTLAAVKAFQRKRGLAPDGVAGLYTWRAIEA